MVHEVRTPTTLTLKGAISMSIYQRKTRSEHYRKIYERHHGPIPKEDNGRSYEVHHIDGDHSNNEPLNLVAITLQEHYDIHYSQGDYGACRLMAIQRMNKTPEEISEICRLHQLQRVENGTHTLLKRPDGTSVTSDRVNHPDYVNSFSTRPDGTNVTSDRTLMGLNPWSKRPDGSSVASDKVSDGTHLWVQDGYHTELNKWMISQGLHASQKKIECPHCQKVVDSPNYGRWHGDKCKYRT